MGYTNYWRIRKIEAYKQALPLVASDLKELLPQLPPLAGWDGRGEPTLKGWRIAFNGVEPEECEPFLLEEWPRGAPGFCKTREKPYDLAVKAALVLLKWHSEAIAPYAVEVRSDGGLTDWDKACELVVEELGYPVDPAWTLGRED